MIAALESHKEDPEASKAYVDKQLKHAEKINQENLSSLEAQYKKQIENLKNELKDKQSNYQKIEKE